MISVLYVDDEQDLLDIAKVFLERTGEFLVRTFTSAEEAIDNPSVSSYDAVISDYQMPGMDGIAFLKAFRKIHPEIPFILFTGRGREEVVIDAINNGADFYLQKGGDPRAQFAELAHKIRQAVARHRVESSLIESEKRLADIIDFLPDATYAIDRSGDVIAWNRAIEGMTGIPASGIIGKGDYRSRISLYGAGRPLIDLLFESDDALFRYYPEVIREGNSLTAEIPVFSPRGHRIDALVKASLLYDSEGVVVGAIEAIRDISGLKKIQESLSHAQKDWESIFRAIAHPVLVLDPYNRIIEVNDVTVRISGRSSEELKGKACYEVFHGSAGNHPPPDCPFEQIRKSGRTHTAELEIETLRGTYDVTCTPVYDADGRLEKVIHIAMDVTARRRAEEELRAAYEQIAASEEELRTQFDELVRSEERIRENEEKYRSLIEQSRDGFFIIQDGRLVFYNRGAFTTITGYAKEELLGRSLIDLVAPEDRETILERHKDRLGGKPVPDSYDLRLLHKDGITRVTVKMNAQLGSYQGRPALIGTIHNVDEDRRRETTLREREDRLTLALEGADLGTWYWNVRSGEVVVNERWAEMLGYRKEEIEPSVRSWEERIHPDDRSRVMQALHAHLAGDTGTYETEHRLRHRSGEWIWILDKGRIFQKDGDGKPLIVAGTHLDITQKKNAEMALLKYKACYKSLFENSVIGIYRTRRDGRFITLNHALAVMFGYDTPEQMLHDVKNTGLQLYANPDDRAAVEQVLAEKGVIEPRELPAVRRDGSQFWVSLVAWRVPGPEDGTCYYEGIVIDVTEHRKASEELERRESLHKVHAGLLLSLMQSGILLRGDAGLAIRKITETCSDIVSVERVSVWLFRDDNQVVRCIDRYQRENGVHQDGEEFLTEQVPEFLSMLRSGVPVVIADTSRDPRVSDLSRLYYQRNAVSSSLDVPFWIHGQIGGYLSFEQIGEPRSWAPDEEQLAVSMAPLVSLCFEAGERIRTEVALQESEEKYRLYVDESPIGVFVSDENGLFLEINPAFCRITGYDQDTLLNSSSRDIFPEEEQLHLNEAFRSIQEKGSVSGEFLLLHRKGYRVWIQADIVGIGCGRYLGYVRDVTRRKRAEQSLSENEEKFRTLVETSPDVIWEIDPQGNFRYISPNISAILGYEPEELLGKPVVTLNPEHARPFIKQEIAKHAASHRGLFTVEVPARHKDGHDRFIEIRSTPVIDQEGNLTGLRGVAHDITERKQAQAALAESEERYRVLVTTVPDIVVRTDLEGKIVYMNEQGLEMGSYSSPSEILGAPISLLVAPEDLDRANENLRKMFEGRLGPVEYTFIDRLGTCHSLEINGDVLRSPDGIPYGMVFVGRDITRRKQADEAIRRAHRQLTMLSGITRHDIQNNVTAMLGYLEMAKSKATNSELTHLVQELESRTRQISSQIEFTRIYQDLGSNEPRWQNISSVLEKIPVPDGITLDNRCNGLEIFADPMVEKVIFNLIDNSVRHGGHVTRIRLYPKEADEGRLFIQYEDNGTGIPDSEKSIVFEWGYGQNTGLGLFLVREILALTGISIAEDGEFGTGVRFAIQVPEGKWRQA